MPERKIDPDEMLLQLSDGEVRYDSAPLCEITLTIQPLDGSPAASATYPRCELTMRTAMPEQEVALLGERPVRMVDGGLPRSVQVLFHPERGPEGYWVKYTLPDLIMHTWDPPREADNTTCCGIPIIPGKTKITVHPERANCPGVAVPVNVQTSGEEIIPADVARSHVWSEEWGVGPNPDLPKTTSYEEWEVTGEPGEANGVAFPPYRFVWSDARPWARQEEGETAEHGARMFMAMVNKPESRYPWVSGPFLKKRIVTHTEWEEVDG